MAKLVGYLTVSKDKVIELYKGHALCKQYHSEFKTDMDLVRLPSSKFATNDLVMGSTWLTYNIFAVGRLGGFNGEEAGTTCKATPSN